MTRKTKARSNSPAKSGTKRAAKRGRAPKRVAAAKRAAPSRAKASRKPAAPRAKGPQDVAASFTANDAAASVKWYTDVLGFSVKERWEQEGSFLGATLVNGKASINIGQDDWKLGRDRKKGQGVRLFITTADDIDKYASAITSRGGTLDHEPKDDWGFRAFSIADPDGYKITFMRPLKQRR
jgi:catechol 2,3-dioxygenase-like lactoylglutathione lyase family enzyme